MSNKDTLKNGTAVTGYGTTFEIFDKAKGRWIPIAGVTSSSGPTANKSEIDITTLSSPAKEYVLDLKDYGTVELSGILLHGNDGQKLVDDLFNSDEKADVVITVKDDGYDNGAVFLTFEARVSGEPTTIAMSAANQITVTLRITGDVKTLRPTDKGYAEFKANNPSLLIHQKGQDDDSDNAADQTETDQDNEQQAVLALTYSPQSLKESSNNGGAVSSLVSLTLSGDSFQGEYGKPMAAVTFSNVPEGITPQAQKTSNTTAVISFSGTATNHQDGTEEHMTVSFTDGAFATHTASEITGATNTQITLAFKEE